MHTSCICTFTPVRRRIGDEMAVVIVVFVVAVLSTAERIEGH